MSDLPLEGIRVLDLTWVWAGPFATLQLAYLGAEILRIESSTRPCTSRRLPPFADGIVGLNRSGYFNQYNQLKRSVGLNLKHPESFRILRQLVEKCDVVADNFAAGVMDRMGLGYEEIRKTRPDVIQISMSGYGSTGPEKDYVSYGPAQVPLSGLSSLSGHAGHPPMHVGFSYGDPNAGLHGAFAILCALMHRAQTGKGQYIDLSQWETSSVVLGEGLMDQLMNGTQPPRMGNRDPHMAPHGVFRCQGDQRWVSIAVGSDEEWKELSQVIGGERLASDPRFATLSDRQAYEDELEEVISEWTRQRSSEEVTERLQAAGVAAYSAVTNRELAEDDHLRARGFFVELPHPEVGVRQHLGPPWVLSDVPRTVSRPAPVLGQDTEAVLGELLGYSAQTIGELRKQGVVE